MTFWCELFEFERTAVHVAEIPTVSDWADAERYVPPPSPKPGRWSTDWAPYLREPMDAAGDRSIRQVTLMCAVQVGKTELLINVLGRNVVYDPGSVLFVSSTDDSAKETMLERIRPSFLETPTIRRLFSPRKTDNRAGKLRLGRSLIYVAGSNSPAALASKPIRDVYLDETDKYPGMGKGGREGDSVSLAKDRTLTYRDSKCLCCSSPTTRIGLVWREYEKGDQRRYFVPCPHCGCFQELEFFAGLKWRKDVPIEEIKRSDGTWYECKRCEKRILPEHKTAIVARGVWVPKDCEIDDAGQITGNTETLHRSYHLSAMVSPWLTWGDLAYEWTYAQGDVGALVNFFNGYLGWIWEEQADAAKTSEVNSLVDESLEEKIVPEWAQILTAGVDVGVREVHCTVRAWGFSERSATIWTPLFDSVEVAVRALSDSVFHKRSGQKFQVHAIAVDSQYDTSRVVALSRRNPRVRPIVGKQRLPGVPFQPRRVDRTSSGKIAKRSATKWDVDTTYYKDKLVRMVRATEGEACFWRVHGTVPDAYLRHLVAEHKIFVRKPGGAHLEWVPRPGSGPNHWLDAEVYCCAVADMAGVFSLRDPKESEEIAAAAAANPVPYRAAEIRSGRGYRVKSGWLKGTRGGWGRRR